MKWKPPSENSIDFLLQLKFPALPDRPTECDFTKKPYFLLMMNHGRDGTHYYDSMDVDDGTWDECVAFPLTPRLSGLGLAADRAGAGGSAVESSTTTA